MYQKVEGKLEQLGHSFFGVFRSSKNGTQQHVEFRANKLNDLPFDQGFDEFSAIY